MSRDRELYRIPQEGRIAGVCAGLGEYFNMETWLVRIIMVSGLLFSGFMFIIGYVAAWFILDAKPIYTNDTPAGVAARKAQREARRSSRKEKWKKSWNEIDEQVRAHLEPKPVEVKQKVWQAGEPPAQAFRDISGQFRDLEKRLQNLETYVTSSEFTVSREIDRL